MFIHVSEYIIILSSKLSINHDPILNTALIAEIILSSYNEVTQSVMQLVAMQSGGQGKPFKPDGEMKQLLCALVRTWQVINVHKTKEYLHKPDELKMKMLEVLHSLHQPPLLFILYRLICTTIYRCPLWGMLNLLMSGKS